MKKIIFILILFVSLASCKKDIPGPEDKLPSTMEELQVPSNFNWKTSKDIELTVTGKADGIVSVTSTGGNIYQKAYLNANQAYTMRLTLPSYEKSIRIQFMGQQVTLELTSMTLTHQF